MKKERQRQRKERQTDRQTEREKQNLKKREKDNEKKNRQTDRYIEREIRFKLPSSLFIVSRFYMLAQLGFLKFCKKIFNVAVTQENPYVFYFCVCLNVIILPNSNILLWMGELTSFVQTN